MTQTKRTKKSKWWLCKKQNRLGRGTTGSSMMAHGLSQLSGDYSQDTAFPTGVPAYLLDYHVFSCTKDTCGVASSSLSSEVPLCSRQWLVSAKSHNSLTLENEWLVRSANGTYIYNIYIYNTSSPQGSGVIMKGEEEKIFIGEDPGEIVSSEHDRSMVLVSLTMMPHKASQAVCGLGGDSWAPPFTKEQLMASGRWRASCLTVWLLEGDPIPVDSPLCVDQHHTLDSVDYWKKKKKGHKTGRWGGWGGVGEYEYDQKYTVFEILNIYIQHYYLR